MARARVNDIDVTVPVRAPVLYRDRDGSVRHAAFVQRPGPRVVVRGVVPGDLRPFPEGAPPVLDAYRIHDGRTWLPVPMGGRAFRAWEYLHREGAAPVARAISALSGMPEPVTLAVFGRSPLSVRRGDGQLNLPPAPERADLDVDEGLVPRAQAWVEARFRADVVHDGEAVYVATGLPVMKAAGRFERNIAPRLLTPPEIEPLRGPTSRVDLCGAYLDVARRHCPVTRVDAMSALADAVAYHADRAGIPLDDADLAEAVSDLPCTALEWADLAAERRNLRRVGDAIGARTPRALSFAVLGASGLLEQREEAEALEAGLDLVRTVMEVAPNLQGWRHLAFVREHAEAIARPRVITRIPVPEADAEALDVLTP